MPRLCFILCGSSGSRQWYFIGGGIACAPRRHRGDPWRLRRQGAGGPGREGRLGIAQNHAESRRITQNFKGAQNLRAQPLSQGDSSRFRQPLSHSDSSRFRQPQTPLAEIRVFPPWGVRPQWAAKEPRILERSRWDAHGSALGISASRAKSLGGSAAFRMIP